MGKHNHYKAQDFIDAIKGSGGIISTIARRVGCSWHTAKKYIENYATVKQAYADEVGTVGDMVDSIIIRNLQLISEEQKTSKKPVDITDAKWYATVKLAGRGYAPKQQVEHFGKLESDVTITDQGRDRAISALADAIATAVHSVGEGRDGAVDAAE